MCEDFTMPVFPHYKILIADDESSIKKSLNMALSDKYQVFFAATGEEALVKVEEENPDLILLDLRLPDANGLDILRKIKKIDEYLMVIVISAVIETKSAVEAMKNGAYDYITKPFDLSELEVLISRALEKRDLIKENIFLKAEITIDKWGELIGKSKPMQKVYGLIKKAAESDCAVLVMGESGTGKELITRAIQARSARANGPFVVVNCAAIPENLLESELFGYERGAFTGAMERKEGKFELANRGTIFLDEIGSMSLALQAKILRVLQPRDDGLKEIERVGGNKSILVDVRVIAATNTNLEQAVTEKKFRSDLYYRLKVFPIKVPPLRQRQEDTPELVDYFLRRFCKKLNKCKIDITPAALEVLIKYRWPGNVRELENLTERLVALNDRGKIDLEDLPLEILVHNENFAEKNPEVEISLKEAVEQLERKFIKRAINKAQGNQSKAAAFLGIHRNTLQSKLIQLGLQEEI